MFNDPLPRSGLWSNLRQPDGRLHRFDLTEEWANPAELVMPPVLEQTRCLRGDLPLVWVGKLPPGVNVAAHLVDDRGRVVLLRFGGEAFAFVENKPLLGGVGFLPLLRLRNRGDEFGLAPKGFHLLRRLPLFIQLPVPLRAGVRGVEDGLVKEGIAHGSLENDGAADGVATAGDGAAVFAWHANGARDVVGNVPDEGGESSEPFKTVEVPLFIEREAGAGIEPANGGFADLGLTTWLPRRERGHYRKGAGRCQSALAKAARTG